MAITGKWRKTVTFTWARRVIVAGRQTWMHLMFFPNYQNHNTTTMLIVDSESRVQNEAHILCGGGHQEELTFFLSYCSQLQVQSIKLLMDLVMTLVFKTNTQWQQRWSVPFYICAWLGCDRPTCMQTLISQSNFVFTIAIQKFLSPGWWLVIGNFRTKFMSLR
jgi:hypothetical protein